MKAIVPVAGLGTRMLPTSKACTKELLPIVDKPVLQLIVQDLVLAGVREIIFVVSSNKRALQKYFARDLALEKMLKDKGRFGTLRELNKLLATVDFKYVEQKEPLGDGHAVLCASKYIKNEPCLVVFGDDLIDAETPCPQQILKAYQKYKAPILTLQQVPQAQVSSYGIVGGRQKAKGIYALNQFVEKPDPDKAPSNLAIVGKYLITPVVLKFLQKIKYQTGREIRLIDAFYAMAENNLPVYGLEFKGQRFDTGNKLGYAKAFLHYALKDKQLRPELRGFLEEELKAKD